MITVWALAALCAAGPARGQMTYEVKSGALDEQIRVAGTVAAADIFRLKSTIESRTEQIWTTTGVWVNPGQSLGYLVNKEFSALLDSRLGAEKEPDDRWQAVYKPVRIRCPRACFLLKSIARSKQWVKPQTVLFEAAAHLRLVADVRPEDAHLVRNGQVLEYWDKKEPDRHYQTRIARYTRVPPREDTPSPGSFAVNQTPRQFLPPGTAWEGFIVPAKKNNAVFVPTAALLRFGDEAFLPVKVSVGITTPLWTEITEGVEPRRRILVIEDAKFRDTQRDEAGKDGSKPNPGEDPYAE
ncbi:MAG TPA: hypothetical protein DEB40_11410 [Elusimicrobia bacterium]|nr:hypothetical protein [Elusimicrobiota bacterium]HBT62340.1 hypothetical protein [Elusimicrobiota bacterium]